MVVDNEIKPQSINLEETIGNTEISNENETKAVGINHIGKTVAEMEQGLIIDTLEHCLGNRTHAANILGISIRTLRNKLKQYSEQGVTIPAPGDSGTQTSL